MAFVLAAAQSLRRQVEYQTRYDKSSEEFAELRVTPMHVSIRVSKLMDIADEYDKCKQFYLAVLNSGFGPVNIDGKTLQNGMYLRAFYEGVMEYLAEVDQFLAPSEDSVFSDQSEPQLDAIKAPLCDLEAALKSLSFLNKLIRRITSQNLHGCQILDACIKYSFLSPQLLITEKLVKRLEVAFSRQLKSWLVSGMLLDPNEEWFIRAQVLGAGRGSILDTSFATCSFGTTSSGAMVSAHTVLPDILTSLNPQYLPCHIPYSLASKIMNTGRLLLLLKCVPDQQDKLETTNYEVDEKKLLKELEVLEKETPVNSKLLEEAVNNIWSEANKVVRRLCEEVGGLTDVAKLFYQVLLMQRGDIIKQFLVVATPALHQDLNKLSKSCLNDALEGAFMDICGHTKGLERLSLSILPSPPANNTLARSLSGVKAKYRAAWPLHLVFSEELTAQYNIIFIFLLRLRISHSRLTSLWKTVHRLQLPLSLKMAVLQTYNRLLIFFTNLENYIFVDVIEPAVGQWVGGLSEVETFDEITQTHSSLLVRVLFSLFFVGEDQSKEWKRGLIHDKLMNLVTICDNFSDLIEKKMEIHTFEKEAKQISKLLQSSLKILMEFLGKVHMQTSSEHILVLMLRLDYNNYYNTECTD